MFNDLFIHNGEVWGKVKYACKLPLIGYVTPDIPIRMSEENFKKLVKMGHPVMKIPTHELYMAPLGKFHEPSPLAHQDIEDDVPAVKEEKAKVVQEPVKVEEPVEVKVQPTVENVVPDNCALEMSSVGDMLAEQQAEDEAIENADEEEEAITRNDVNKMKKAELQKLLDFLEVPYDEGMVVKELRALVLEELNL